LLPFLREDLQARPYLGLEGWPFGLGELSAHLSRVENVFGIDGSPFDERLVGTLGAGRDIPTADPDFLVRFAKWPPFQRRNLANVFGDLIRSDRNLRIWINATATTFNVDRGSGRLSGVTATSQGGRQLKVLATETVVCAGAIESTRLLLLANRSFDDRIFNPRGAVGRYLNDHISLPAAELRPRSVPRLNAMTGFRFAGRTMRSVRFELSPQAQAQDGVGSAFCHVSFTTQRPSGFEALRDLLRGWQQSGRLRPGLAVAALRDAPYLIQAAYWRYAKRRLLWPKPARYHLHLVAEQLPDRRNRISLAEKLDGFGLPLAAITWRKRESDIKTLDAVRQRFDSYWSRRGLNAAAGIEWFRATETGAEWSDANDIFHPCGTTRMGVDPQTSVVDPGLSLHAIANLSVASTSVFPSGASANPTLMLMLLALRLSDHLAGRLCKAQ
jgi:choline dehydrogenase-like flavoprotein